MMFRSAAATVAVKKVVKGYLLFNGLDAFIEMSKRVQPSKQKRLG